MEVRFVKLSSVSCQFSVLHLKESTGSDLGAMATLLDSEAQFIQRTLDLKLSEELKRSLKVANLQTFGTLAYAHGQPGQNIVDSAFETWLTTNILTGASVADLAGAKRLLFESQTMVLAALQDSVNAPDSTTVKKVPHAERETKMRALKNKLSGLLIEGPLEPGHSLLDLAASMYQRNEILYIPPEKSVSRTHEVLTQKSPTKMLDISSESLIVKEKTDVQDMVVSSALQVQESLQRRGLALVFADLIQHSNYTRYLTTLFSHLHREPPQGYSRCSVSQLVAADKLVWQALLEEGVQPKRNEQGELALDTKLISTLESYRVSFTLLPMIAKKEGPGHAPKKTKPQQPANTGKGAINSVQKPWMKQKGGKKGGKSKQRVPSHIFKLGGTASNPEGDPICFGFNSEGGCAEAADGAKCRRGLHICSKCYASHSILQHGT